MLVCFAVSYISLLTIQRFSPLPTLIWAGDVGTWGGKAFRHTLFCTTTSCGRSMLRSRLGLSTYIAPLLLQQKPSCRMRFTITWCDGPNTRIFSVFEDATNDRRWIIQC